MDKLGFQQNTFVSRYGVAWRNICLPYVTTTVKTIFFCKTYVTFKGKKSPRKQNLIPSFSLTIPALFEHEILKMAQTKQEIELYLFVGYRLKFKKSGFFPEIDVSIATR